MSRRILAIDIRTHSLSALLLTTGMKNMVVEDYADIEMIAESETRDEIEALSSALLELKSAFDTTNASVVVGLPAHRSHYRALNFPFSDEKRIRQILAFELEPILPLPVDRLVSDFNLISEKGGATVLTATTDRQYLDAVLDAFNDNGLRPQAVVPGGFSLPLRFSHHKEQSPEQYMMMDIDGDKATLLAVQQGNILSVRSIKFDLDADEAMHALGANVRQTLLGFTDTISYQFKSEFLYITGQKTLSQQMIDKLGQIISLNVKNFELRKSETRIEHSPATYDRNAAVSDSTLALALVEAEQKAVFYYHRTGSAVQNLWSSYKTYLKTPITLLVALIVVYFIGFYWEIHILRQRVDQIDQEILEVIQSAFPEVKSIGGRPADLMKSKLEEFKKSQVDYAATGGQTLTIDILEQLNDLIPKDVDVRLNRLNISSDIVTVSGETVDYNTVEDIKSRLEKSSLFKSVSITNSDRDKTGKKVRFRLRVDI